MSSGLEVLTAIGEQKPRNSRGILKAGLDLLGSFNLRRGLGDDIWEVRERVFLAALDEFDLDTAEKMLKEIEKKFPDSVRMNKLKGLLFEVQGNYKDARTLYGKLEKENEHDQGAVKRKVAILKALGHTDKALKELTSYLEVFQSDQEAWQELALLNVDLGNYAAATFCYEELILHAPTNPFFHLICGESMYTQGGARNMLDARKYISQSLVMRPAEKGNLRALFGLAVTTNTIQKNASSVALAIADDEDPEEVESMNRKLNKWACDKLLEISNNGKMCHDLSKMVKEVAGDLQVEKN
uniref:ER membrane protein complex subunit 2 n=1 Tax=Aplanochytrium stocchinoi TaxID=215587 RepID=A0A7S3LMF9_9STRA|mmetsp:Transcript_24421/g.29824  ORF Transcript_24421/g.29824 Transcript_24421/m.29824 type:complete len:298 (-) Transcript_24421:1167-2060(-)|eukprot:CAMPEP_0204839884 /NCGR_PEP_ID=MMETSP1346-20131115/35789_1 /ASSEMBLY_ACC=CAM_ASM_000771 /TAXON_ID=215587 /ORGANISM="Aplanochytrium stocchinoi, Strain GSBS06" /LENGTH=297 /DNA_ID=CAMNT_0051976949 /DNA_START=227 /DNA_END=1120 /DNA_ORIENTATION=+